MKQHRTIRYRLHPGTQAKARKLAGTAGACRFVWNHFVGKLRDEYRCYGGQRVWRGKTRLTNYSWYTIGTQFTLLRRHSVPWLQDYSANVVKRSLKPIETNYRQFFKGEGGLPRFKAKWRDAPSFPLCVGTFRLKGRYLHIAKIGEVLLLGHNPYPDAKPVSGTVKRECGNWYAYIVYEVGPATAAPHAVREVGMDRNVGQVALSDGTIYRRPDMKRLEARKRHYQKMMARRDRGDRKTGRKPSNRYLRAKRLAARASAKAAHARKNWCHQVSRKVADEYDLVYLENLNTRGMTASAKGTADAPGKNVRQKAGLNRAILGTGWHKLEQCLSYKTNISKVPAHHTSQTCHKCRHVAKENRKTQADFQCVACGHRDNADVNAALNILASGNGAAGRGGTGVARPVKRQIDARIPDGESCI